MRPPRKKRYEVPPVRRERRKAMWLLLAVVVLFIGLLGVSAAVASGRSAEREVYEIRTDRLTPTPTPTPVPWQQYDVPLGDDLLAYIYDRCEELGLDMPLVLAIIERESGYDPAAVGDDGQSYGLMGVYASEWTELCIKLGVERLQDARQNIRAGTAILREMLDKGRGQHYALMAYNGGEPYADELFAEGITSTVYSRGVSARAVRFESE